MSEEIILLLLTQIYITKKSNEENVTRFSFYFEQS